METLTTNHLQQIGNRQPQQAAIGAYRTENTPARSAGSGEHAPCMRNAREEKYRAKNMDQTRTTKRTATLQVAS